MHNKHSIVKSKMINIKLSQSSSERSLIHCPSQWIIVLWYLLLFLLFLFSPQPIGTWEFLMIIKMDMAEKGESRQMLQYNLT